ncbi:MAG TPA: Plug domain-containing protein, partial [Longimicrobiaceae bacterium]
APQRRDLVLGGGSTALAGRTVASRQRSSGRTRVMTREEIQQSGLTNAMDLVTHVRPEWNQMRGPATTQLTTVHDPNTFARPSGSASAGGSAGGDPESGLSARPAPESHDMISKVFPALYVDGARVEYSYGDDVTHAYTETLRRIPAAWIEKIEFLSGPEAAVRLGTDSPNGAILITTHSH